MNEKYQDFLKKLQNSIESERDWLVMEFSLQNLSETLQQAVWAAAIPHWIDRNFLNAVLANPLKESDFKALTELSFIEVYPERGFNVHERSRNLLLDKLWSNNKARYQKISKRAAAYCKKQDQNVAVWRVETLYHGLLANNLSAKDSFIKQGIDWNNSFQYDNLENLTQVVLEAVTRGKLTGDIAGYAYDFQALLDGYYSRYEAAKNHLEFALAQKIQSKNLKADCLFDLGRVYLHFEEYEQARVFYQKALKIYQQIKVRLGWVNCIYAIGDVHFFLSEYDQARDYYQQALKIYQQIKDRLGEANCIRGLGNIHRFIAEYEQARDCYQKALPIFRISKSLLGEANCIHAIGDMHLVLAEYDQARDFYQKALKIFQQIKYRLGEANSIRSLGLLYGARQQIKLAVATLQQAAQLYEEIGDKGSKATCFYELAALYQRQKQFELALVAFNQAIEIFPSEVQFYLNRAELYMQMDEYEKAETDIKQAETIDADDTYTVLCKAEFALWKQQTPQAVELCQQALNQRPNYGNFRAFFALTLLANGQAQAAYKEMEQALTAIYQQHDFDDLLNNLNKLVNIYGHSAGVEVLRGQILNHPVIACADQGYKPDL